MRGKSEIWALIQLLLGVFGSMLYEVPHRYLPRMHSQMGLLVQLQHIGSCSLSVNFVRYNILKAPEAPPRSALGGIGSTMTTTMRSGRTSLPRQQREYSYSHHVSIC
jgi:hypothetical protein